MKKHLLKSLLALALVLICRSAWGETKTVIYTVTSSSAVSVSGTAPAGSSAVYSSTYSTKCQLTSGNSMTLTLNGYDGCTIKGVTLSMKSNSKGGGGSFTLKAGATTLASISDSKFNSSNWYGSWSTSYVTVTPSMSNAIYSIAGDESVVLTIAATENSLYCESMTFTYEEAAPAAVAKPTFSPIGGSYSAAQNVTIACATEGATIYYTTDGDDPTTSSSSYSDAIPVTVSGTVIKALAVKGTDQSSIASATYTIVPESPVIDIDDNVLTITVGTGLTIYYTLDGSNPTESSTEYTGPVSLTESCTVKAIAVDANGNVSDVVSGKYTKIVNTSPKSNYFTLVTDANTLAAGDNLLFVYETNAMSTTQNNNNRGVTTVTKMTVGSTSFIDGPGTEAQRIILQGSAGSWLLFVGDGYLYSVSGNNYLRTKESADDAAIVTSLSISEGVATILFGNTSRYLKYNSQNGIFSCYTSGQNSVSIYKEVERPQNVKSDANFSFPEAKYYVEKTETFTTPVLSKAEGYDGTISYESSKTEVATVDNTGAITIVGVGTTTITASADETANFYAASASYDLTVYQLEDGVFDFTYNYDYGSGLTPKNDNTYVTDESTWTAGNVTMVVSGKYRWWSNDGTLRLFTPDSGETTMTISAPSGNVITSVVITGSNLNGITADKGTYSNGTWTGASQSIVFTRSSENLQAKSITVTYMDGTLPVAISAGWATACVPFQSTMSGATAYIVTGTSDDALTLFEVTGEIPANTGLLLKGAGTVTFTASNGTPADVTGNMLVGTTVAGGETFSASGTTYYILANDPKDGLGFYYQVDGGVSATCAPYKAVLAVPAGSSSGAIGFRLDGATKIDAVQAAAENAVIYDLTGRRVENPARGIYIVNGKKMLVK